MNEVRKFLGALRDLKEGFGMNGGSFIEYAARMAALIELADEERRPVADKALRLWLERGQQLREWLCEQSAEAILQAGGPAYRVPVTNIIIDMGYNPWTPLRDRLRRRIADSFGAYPHREACAEAAQWLVMNGIRVGSGNLDAVEWLKMGDIHSPLWIIQTAHKYLKEFNDKREKIADAVEFCWKIHKNDDYKFLNICREWSPDKLLISATRDLEDFNAKRQPVADAARVLFTVYGRPACDFIEAGLMPVETMTMLDKERAAVADAAWLLLEHGLCDWHNILKDRDGYHILDCARSRMAVIDAQRELTADRAQSLVMDYGLGFSTIQYAAAQGEI